MERCFLSGGSSSSRSDCHDVPPSRSGLLSHRGEEAARRFYADLLGLVEVAKPPELAARGGIWFRGAGYELHIGVETPFVPSGKAHAAFLVEDLDGAARALTDAGHLVSWDSSFEGYVRFHTADPHGNRVELLGDRGTPA